MEIQRDKAMLLLLYCLLRIFLKEANRQKDKDMQTDTQVWAMKEDFELVKEFNEWMGYVDKGGEDVREELLRELNEKQEERERLYEENAELKRKVKAMSSKNLKVMLTQEGVYSLYDESVISDLRLQVLFKVEMDTKWCLRLSDGHHISPVVFILAKRINGPFTVGTVITVKEKIVVPYDYSPEAKVQMEDTGMYHVYIKSYDVYASAEMVGKVIGLRDHKLSYREEISFILPALAKWHGEDEQLMYELEDSNQSQVIQEEAKVLREKGNQWFKNGQYPDALHFYAMAAKQDKYEYRVWSNISHIHFKLENYLQSEVDAVFAMKLNPFCDKAYYRAAQAALKGQRPDEGHQYAVDGIFLCGETKDLMQISVEAKTIKEEPLARGGIFLGASLSCAEVIVSSCLSNTIDLVEKVRSTQKTRTVFKEVQEAVQMKKILDLRNAFGREPRKENKKAHKKLKKPGDDAAAALTAAATSKDQEKKVKEEETKKHVPEPKKEEKNNKKTKISFNEVLQEARRLFQSEQFQQAIEMYNKCLSSSELTDSIKSSVKRKEGVRYVEQVTVIYFIVGMCKVQSSRGYLYEGLETMQTLCHDGSRFPNKPAARYWLAVSFEKICCFKLAQKHSQMCKDFLQKYKSVKPIKWPGTDQTITITQPSELEEKCKLLLERLSAKPTPKAKCRYKKCITTQGIPYAKEEIYLMDPDFKGYIHVMCEEDCSVSYHPCCWKAYKEQHDGSISRISDKDLLGRTCVTPDCNGKIFSIKIYDDAGELKNEVMKDKKDRKNLSAPVKQKKKKDKKKEKNQTYKKRNRIESVSEEHGQEGETSAGGAESTGRHNNTSTSSANNSNSITATTNINSIKQKSQPLPVLPIDPESLDTAQVTILKPGVESQPPSPHRATKKNKKKKTKKTVNQPNLLADPLETDLSNQNEYVARLQRLQQQRDALEANENINAICPLSSDDGRLKPWMLLDPDNPFYLPHHLRDNPEELETVLQNKFSTNSPSGLQKETVDTLLDFMYDWLKSEGPMHTSDPRLVEQVTENFPQEAQEYVSRCGNITQFLMQSINFAMIDSIICVRDDVIKAQKMRCKEVSDKMNQCKYLIYYSDGKKAKRFTHLLDDAKSTCSDASSSVADSYISRDSAFSTKFNNNNNISHNNTNSMNANIKASINNNIDIDSNVSLAPVSRSIVEQLTLLDQPDHTQRVTLNPTAPVFEPNLNSVAKEEEEELEEEEEEEEEVASVVKWINGDSNYIESWAAQAREEVPSMSDEEEEEEEEEVYEEEEEEEEQGEEEEEREGDEAAESVQDDEDIEEYIRQLQSEKENLSQDFAKTQELNQKLNDKLIQVKSQNKSEVMKLKQQIEELKDQNKELGNDKHNILSQKEAEVRKFKSDLSRNTDELKSLQSRVQSAELKCERYLDQKNELEAKLAEETELNLQLKEELEKMKNLQESLTSCSRRAREAEVKYLSTKKELIEASMSRAVKRLTEEAIVMRQVLPMVTENTVPDRATLTRTIMAWEETVANLVEQQRTFNEDSTRLLGMIHQGRPLSALPPGDLSVPSIPTLTVAPLLNLFQTNQHNHHNKSSPTQPPQPQPQLQQQQQQLPPAALGVPEAMRGHSPNPGTSAQPPTSPHKPTPPLPVMEPSQVLHISPVPLIQTGLINGHRVFMHNGAPPPPGLTPCADAIPSNPGNPPHPKTRELVSPPQAREQSNRQFVGQPPRELTEPSNPASGAIPKNHGNPPPSKTPELVSPPQSREGNTRLFVGQLPWEFTEADVKALFSRQYGEVVSATVYDKGCNADGRPVPKYGFVTFRKPEDCLKALNARPIYVGNHMLNVQERESKKPPKPASVPTAVGVGVGGGVAAGAGAGAGVGGGGLANIIGEAEVVNGTNCGRTNFPVSGSVETNQPGAALQHHTLPTPTLHHQQPPPPTQPVTKPKFQKLLPSNSAVGTIGTLPPKLVRPQPKAMPTTSKIGSQTTTTKEENAAPPSTTSYTRLIEMCKQRFGKEFSSPDICTALREVRTQNNNSLMLLTTDKIVDRVRQHLRSRKASSSAPSVAPWAGLTQGSGVKTGPEWQGPGSEEVVKEESCSICLEPLNTGPTLPLQCLHTFHENCIKDWLRRQSNCPNCRKFALMTDEYPTLTQK